jgi:glycosyltransferase involved in cell wall biosynthesis
MSAMLAIPAERIDVVPLGITLDGHERRSGDDGVFRVGYFARVSPEKGLHVLAEAYPLFRRRTGDAPVRLEAAGYLAADQRPYLDRIKKDIEKAGLAGEFTYHGAVDRAGKLKFLRTLDVLSVPAPYDEPKGVFLLEAMASGVPVVQPRRGAFSEIVETTGGGILVAPDDPAALAEGLHTVWRDRDLAGTLAERAFRGVRTHYSIKRSADRQLEVYEALVRGASHEPRRAVVAARA